MRIAHVIRRLSFGDWGGTEQVVWNLAKAQMKAGHEVRLFATTALCGTERETVEGVEIRRFKPIYPWWPMPKRLVDELDRKGGNPFVPGLGRALREWEPDIIHCHAMARIAELCIRTAEFLNSQLPTPNHQRPTKCIISLHGGGANVPEAEAKSLMSPTRGRIPWGKMIDYAMGWTRRVPEDADGIVCVGADEADRYRATHKHVLYLPNGVDTRIFSTPTPQPPTPNPQSPTILCVARIDRQKNQMMLVEWLGRHPEAMVRLVGPVTQPDYCEELKARAAALGVADRLVFVGALKPGSAELLAEYRHADLFVLPSRHEPFGIVVLEAWAAGLPVAASNVGGLGRLCAAHPRAALSFAPESLDTLDRVVRRILDDTDVRRDLAEAGRMAAKNYDWQNLGTLLVDFYNKI